MNTLIRALERKVDSLSCLLQSDTSALSEKSMVPGEFNLPNPFKDVKFEISMVTSQNQLQGGYIWFGNDLKLYYLRWGESYLIPPNADLYSMIADKMKSYRLSLKDFDQITHFEWKRDQGSLNKCELSGDIQDKVLTLKQITVDGKHFEFNCILSPLPHPHNPPNRSANNMDERRRTSLLRPGSGNARGRAG